MKGKLWIAALVVVTFVAGTGLAMWLMGSRMPLGQSDGDGAVVQLLKKPMALAPFTVTDLDGRVMSSESLRGKVVIVNFWATWCPPCLAEIPDLIALQAKYKDELVILGVSEDEEPPAVVKKFALDRNMNYPIVMSTPELQKLFPGIVALPTTFLIDRDGQMVQKHVGLVNAANSEAATRFLAGLEVNARVERVDDPNKLNLDNAAQLKEIPGVDLTRFSGSQKVSLLQALNDEGCTCGCGLTVAKCRVDDPTCPVSLPLAKKIVERQVGSAAPSAGGAP